MGRALRAHELKPPRAQGSLRGCDVGALQDAPLGFIEVTASRTLSPCLAITKPARTCQRRRLKGHAQCYPSCSQDARLQRRVDAAINSGSEGI